MVLKPGTLMLAWFAYRARRREMKRIAALVETARAITFHALAEHYRVAFQDPEPRHLARTAAGANVLFGMSQRAAVREQFDMAAVHDEVLEWVGSVPVLCELVVQSLRLGNIVDRELGRITSVVQEPALQAFGTRYPRPLSADDFGALIRKSIDFLPLEAQEPLRQLRLRAER